MTVLEVEGVRHRYGDRTALDGVDLTVGAGECVALLGPNGAGKTTLVGLATGLLARQAGVVRVCGGDPRQAAARRRIGVVQQDMGFPRTENVGELVRGAAVRAGRRAADAVRAMEGTAVADLAGKRAHTLSGGQRRRVALAMAVVGEPDLLLLDEPTVGLDVGARRAFRDDLARRRDAGTGLLLTTHMVEEAAAVADRVVVLHAGRVVAADTPAGLAALLPGCTVTARTALDDAALRALPGVATLRRTGAHAEIGTDTPERLLRSWLALDDTLEDLRVSGATLEQALLALTGTEVPA